MGKWAAAAERTNREIKRRAKQAAAAAAPVEKGPPPGEVLDELVHAKTTAKDYAGAFADAVKAQAAKYGIKPSALRRYVTAREADKLDEARIETKQIADLIG